MRWSFETFLAVRYLKPRRTFVSVITVLSLLGVMLGVGVMIVVLSVMAGFEQELREKVIGFNSPLVLTHPQYILHPDHLIQLAKEQPGVEAATPVVKGPVLAEHRGKVSTPVIRGIDLETSEQVLPLKKYLQSGEFEFRGDSVVVGAEWARRQGAVVGDKILVYSPGSLGDWQSIKKEGVQSGILPREMLITGIFYTGMMDYDVHVILTSLFNAQRFFRLEGGVHEVALKVRDPFAVERMKGAWNEKHRWLATAMTWGDLNRPLFNAIAMERVMMTIVVFFVMIVAAFGLCSTLITITVQKRKEIGLLKSLGAGDRQILGIYLQHGLWVGVFGALGGFLLSHLFLFYRNDIRFWLVRNAGVDVFSPDIYQFPMIPCSQNSGVEIAILLSAILLCTLAALIPAWSAASIPPAQALRSE